MTAISETSFAIEHLFFRSLLPRDKQIRIPDSGRRRRLHYESAALRLATHLAVTSLLFLALVVAIWITSATFHLLHSVLPFPNGLLRLLDSVELWLAYVDGALICCTLLIGGCCYLLDMLRGHS